MVVLPTDPAVLVLVTHERSGWDGYDRGIREHVADARRHPDNRHAFTYWSHKALTLAHLHLIGERWGEVDAMHRARLSAVRSLRPFGMAKVLDEIEADARARLGGLEAPHVFTADQAEDGRYTLTCAAGDYAEGTSPATRFELLGGPGGHLTCLPVGDCRRNDRYRSFVVLAEVGRPLTAALADAAKGWALRAFGC